MKKFDNIFLVCILGLVVIAHVIAYRVWLFSSGVLTQGDWVLSFSNYSKSLLSLPILWKSYLMGSIDLTPPFYPFLLLQGILSNMGVDYAYIERITFMWPIALLTIPFSYLFVRAFTRSRIAALSGALLYAYNTYFLVIQSGQLTLMNGFTFAPLVLLFLKKTVEKKNYYYAILTGIFAFIISLFEFRAFYLVTLISFAYYIYFLLFIVKNSFFTSLKQTIIYALLPLFIVVILNIYWILPYLLATVSLSGTVFDRGLFGNEFFDITKAFTLFHPFWTGDKYLPFIVQSIPFYFFLLPFFAFLGMYLNKKNKDIIFFGLLSFVGIFLSKQSNAPFPVVYAWLFAHFPGFGAFRESSKFYFFIAIGYSVLIGSFIDWIWSNWKKSFYLYGRYLFVLFIVGMSVWNLKTLILSTYGTLFTTRIMPSAYYSVNDYIDNQNDFFRTLWVPTSSRWGTNTDLHPKIGESETLTSTWQGSSDSTKYKTLGDEFIEFLQRKNTINLLNDSSIKYIIIPLADTQNDDNFFVYFLKSPESYINAFSKNKNFKRIILSEKDVAVFENITFKPHIYVTNEKESISGNVPFKKVSFTQNTNSQYTIFVSNVKKPFYLQFTDSYHPDWKIHIGDFHWYGFLFDHNYFLPNTIHSKSAARLNSFYLNPDVFSSAKGITKNPDGSFNITMTLYFVPQTYSYLGIVLSSGALIIFAILGMYFYKHYEKKN